MVRLLADVCCAVPLVGAALAGCAQLAGIEDTSGSDRPSDSLSLTRMSVGTSVETAPLDITGLQATYLVDAGGGAFDRVPAVPDPTRGAWTTKLNAAAPVQFTLPDVPAPILRQFDFPSMHLAVLFALLEHPGATAAPDGATFSVTVPLDMLPPLGVTYQYQNYVVGAWLKRDFAATEVVVDATMQLTPPAYSFVAGNSVAGRAMPDAVTTKDAFLVLRYLNGALTGVAEAAPFAQTEMATAVTTPVMAAVPQDQMVNLTVDPPTLMARYARLLPAALPASLAINWSLVAAPGYQIASNSGPVLLSGSVTTTPGVTASYGNPFVARGWRTLFTLASSEARVYMLPAGPALTPTPISLAAGMNQVLEPPATVDPATPLTLPAALPTRIQFNDNVLVSDGVSVRPPTGFVTVKFDVDEQAEPAASPPLYSLLVCDLVYNPTTMALDRQIVYSATSDHREFQLPPEVFQANHSYTLRAFETRGGFPGMAEGDFVRRELPLAQSFLDSGVFTVLP